MAGTSGRIVVAGWAQRPRAEKNLTKVVVGTERAYTGSKERCAKGVSSSPDLDQVHRTDTLSPAGLLMASTVSYGEKVVGENSTYRSHMWRTQDKPHPLPQVSRIPGWNGTRRISFSTEITNSILCRNKGRWVQEHRCYRHTGQGRIVNADTCGGPSRNHT